MLEFHQQTLLLVTTTITTSNNGFSLLATLTSYHIVVIWITKVRLETIKHCL